MPGFSVYHASKLALEGWAESLRLELSPLGIDSVLIEPGPFATNFFGNVVPSADETVMQSYPHVGEFAGQFEGMLNDAFDNPEAPTDPSTVASDFVKLIEAEQGERPLRTISGLDFGCQMNNDALEPLRVAGLAELQISDLDKVAR